MFNLDPGKLLVIAVVAIILLGPDRLPQVARQVGGAWRSFNEFRHRMESEVRNTMPDLPPTSEIARLARSPSALLNHLSNMSSDEDEEEPDGAFQPPASASASTNGVAGPDTNGVAGPDTNGVAGPDTNGAATQSALAATNGAGELDAATDARDERPPSAPAWTSPAAATTPDVIVPGDPTLN